MELPDKTASKIYNYLLIRHGHLKRERERLRGSDAIPAIKDEIRMLEDALTAFEKADPKFAKLRTLIDSTPGVSP